MAAKPVVALGAIAALTAAGNVAVDGLTIPTSLLEAGPWGLLVGVVAFIFYGVFRGWIVPKPHYDTLMARALAAEAANVRLAETNTVQAETILKNTAVGDTVIRVMSAIQDARETAGGTT